MLHVGNHISIASAQKGSNLNQDANADAFIVASGITDSTQKSAITTFVKDLKAINTVLPNFVNFETPANSILRVCYPFVGGSASAHKLNLIEPIDSDNAFRIVFNGVVTHDSVGIKTAGATSSWGDTKFNPSTKFTSVDNNGMDIFVNSGLGYGGAKCEIGARLSTLYALGNNYQDGQVWVRGFNAINSDYTKIQSIGFHQINMSGTGIGQCKWLGNLNVLGSNPSAIVAAMPNVNIGIGRMNSDTIVSDNYVSYVGIRNAALSDEVNLLYYNAVIKYQKKLNRLPSKNLYIDGHSMMTGLSGYRTSSKILGGINASFESRTLGYFAQPNSGDTVALMQAKYSVIKNKAKVSGLKNILMLWIGVNDMGNSGLTGTQTWTALKSYIETAIADGFAPVCATCLKTSYFSIEAQRVIFNDLMKTDMPVGGHSVDLDLHTEFSDPTNTTYFSDGLHPTATGYAIAVADFVSKINSI